MSQFREIKYQLVFFWFQFVVSSFVPCIIIMLSSSSFTWALLAFVQLAAAAPTLTAQLNALGLSSGTKIIPPGDALQRYTTHDEPTFVAAVQPATVQDVQKIVSIFC